MHRSRILDLRGSEKEKKTTVKRKRLADKKEDL